MKLIQQQLTIDEQTSGMRLDQALAQLLPEYSRSKIQDWIKQGFITLNQAKVKPREKVFDGDSLVLDVPPTTKTYDQPEQIEFEIIHQDADVFVINKPAGLVVHPAAGHQTGTLVNGLLHRDPGLEQLPRAGIVHRLDKDTTGVMVVARTLQAHTALVEALQEREVKREYIAIAQGLITAGRTIDAPMARHPVDRKRMAIREDGKDAITHFRVAERYRAHCLIEVQLETGRTHQIRVHLASIRHPLLGDQTYGGRLTIASGIGDLLEQTIRRFKRQALHAKRLTFEHPSSGETMSFEAGLPADLQNLIEELRADSNHG